MRHTLVAVVALALTAGCVREEIAAAGDPTCTTGQTLCGGACVDVRTDEEHCGACGNACAPGTWCVGGACEISCPAGQTPCAGACVTTSTDEEHCGACGNACPDGVRCVAGACETVSCGGGLVACGGACVNTRTDEEHCGACGNACPAGVWCVEGACPCPDHAPTVCGGVCTSLELDRWNCGACGNRCPADRPDCGGGACTCDGDHLDCGGVCVDRNGLENCGACGVRCGPGGSCNFGTCTCAPGWMHCPFALPGGTIGQTCVDVSNDPANCGSCGLTCGASDTCISARCVPKPCDDGLTGCGAACVDLATDEAHCGACGAACATGATCTSGACACPAGLDACGGACVDLARDASNCGACGRACAQGSTCDAGQCPTGCGPGLLACGNRCVDAQTDEYACGACGTACGPGQACEAGACVASSAPPADGLAVQAVEPPGPRCAHGGRAIRVGLDLSGDAMLQPQEVTSAAWACTWGGTLGVVRLDDEPAGPPCAFGGVSVSAGLDADHDGLLDPAETGETRLVCNAGAVPAGTTLFALAAEPGGDRCPAGGRRLETGLDADSDGLLSADEVQNAAYLCDAPGLAYATSEAQWGGVCRWSGVRVDAGTDADADGELDPGERDPAATRYVCNLRYTGLALGSEHSCALVSDGTVRCWGGNVYGELGNGTSDGFAGNPVPSPALGVEGAARVDAGFLKSCAVLTDGAAMCWGRNVASALGTGVPSSSHVPVPARTLVSGVAAMAPEGFNHGCALLLDGTVRCWGANGDHELGGGTAAAASPAPVSPIGVSGATSIEGGLFHTCASLSDGTVACWGANRSGQLGDGTLDERTAPVAVTGLAGVSSIGVGEYHACAALADGTARCWGTNAFGELGDGTTTPRPAPVGVAGLADVASVAAAGSFTITPPPPAFTCAALRDGTARCWGSNVASQLGDGTSETRLTPVAVNGISGVEAIDAGSGHTCALVDGAIWCWGTNAKGERGDGSTTDPRPAPTRALWPVVR